MRRPAYAPNKYRTHNLPSAADLDKSLDDLLNDPLQNDDGGKAEHRIYPWKPVAAAALQLLRLIRGLLVAVYGAISFGFNAALRLLRALASRKRKPRPLSTVNANTPTTVSEQRLLRQARQPAPTRKPQRSRAPKESPPRATVSNHELKSSANGIKFLIVISTVAILLLGWQAFSSFASSRPDNSSPLRAVDELSVAGPVSHDPDHAVFNIPLKVTFAHQPDEGPLDPAIINKVRFSYGKGESIESHPLQVVVIDSSEAPQTWKLMFTFPESVAGEQITLRATLKGIPTDVQLLFIQLTTSATE